MPLLRLLSHGTMTVTRGFDADQTESAIKATERMLNIIENFELKKTSNKKLMEA
jgi:hypothetical protein